MILGIGYHLFFGENILNSVLENAKVGDLLALYGSYGTWLHIWMYGIYILACKEAVLLVGLLSELLLMRIPLRYHSGQNAVTFVSFYYLFCQNAIFRGISLLEAALVQSCGHFHTFIHGDSASRSESFSARNIFSCSRFPETDRSRSLIILSLMNRTPPVFTIFHFSQTSADGSPRKRKQANGKCSLSQMAEPLKYQSMRPKQPRKCSLMRQTVSMPRK